MQVADPLSYNYTGPVTKCQTKTLSKGQYEITGTGFQRGGGAYMVHARLYMCSNKSYDGMHLFVQLCCILE